MASSPVNQLQSLLADAVRSRVVGPDANQRSEAIFLAPGERWFADDRPIREVHSDASMFIGGLRALLFQSLHPLAMAGVARHSNYRHDPWGRLQRTADFLAATTFGPSTEAQRAVDVVKLVHQRVRGVTDDLREYSANDPRLMLWVHIAEVDSFIESHRRFGATPLASYDGYVEDMAVVARALGVPNPPTNVGELRGAVAAFRPELASSAEARDAARYLVLQPPLPMAVRPVYSVLAAGAISLLPVWTRWPLRLPWLPISESTSVRAAAHAMTRTMRWALSGDSPAQSMRRTGSAETDR